MTRTPSPQRRPIRWWPAILIAVVMSGLLAYFWLSPASSDQARVIPTFPTVGFGVTALFLWLVLFSRLPGRTRLRIFAGVAAVAILGALTLEIKGVSGNLVPILGWRWSGPADFGGGGPSGSLAVVPGPNDYPQFYGPRRNAVLAGPKLARDWSSERPTELWRHPVGEGWSSFAIVGDAAFTQELRGDQEVVVRYDRDTGEQIWVHSDEAPFNTTVGGSGPRATPTFVDGRIYTLGATGILNCLDAASGELAWTTNVLQDHDANQPEWGMASSPLVIDDLVIVQLGRRGRLLAAYDRSSGEPAWRSDADSGSYNTPALLDLGGRAQLVSVNGASVTGHDPATGALLWSEPWEVPAERVAPALRLSDELILVSAGYGAGSRLLRVTGGDGAWRVEEIWESRRLKSKFAPMVVHEGVIYGLDDGVLVAIDPQTGERLWKRGRYGHGQLVLVDDLLLIQAENGEVVLVEANPEEHRELASFAALDGKTWNPPALSGDLLLVRNNKEAAAYRLPLAP